MAKALTLFLLLVATSFTVFAEEVETLPQAPLHPPQAAPPHHRHHHLHPPSHSPSPTPTAAPIHPPTHPPAHPPHRHPHHHPPAPAPTPAKPPLHPHPPTPAPAKPPTHHYPPTPPPPTHHHYPPTAAPVKPPTPAPAPVHPPPHPLPRSFVAVQGVVYTKSCKYAGLDTLLGATPVLGAVVKLECNNTKYRMVQTLKTDKNGYFYVQAPKTITTYGAHKCMVFLVSSPTGLKPSNLHGGLTGSPIRPEKPFMYQKLPFLLYNVGPLAFEPKCPH